MQRKLTKEEKEEQKQDERIHKDLIKRLQAKGLVLIDGVWQKPNNSQSKSKK